MNKCRCLKSQIDHIFSTVKYFKYSKHFYVNSAGCLLVKSTGNRVLNTGSAGEWNTGKVWVHLSKHTTKILIVSETIVFNMMMIIIIADSKQELAMKFTVKIYTVTGRYLDKILKYQLFFHNVSFWGIIGLRLEY